MANIRLDLNYTIVDGTDVVFKAPCDCTAVDGLIIYYPTCMEDSQSTTSKTFTFKDAHGNTLTNIGNLFLSNNYVKAILDVTNGVAYLQNADTNGYLEGQLKSKATRNVYTATLSKSSWSQNGNYYRCGTFVSELQNGDEPHVSPVLDMTNSTTALAVKEAWNSVFHGEALSGYIQFYATEQPTVDIPIQIEVIR